MVLPYTDMNQPWMYMCPPTWTLLPPPSPPSFSGSSQCTGPERPVSCTERGLAIYFTYGNRHVSMLFSHIIPPSPSPTESKSVLYICVSFAVSHIGSSLPSFWIPYVYVNILYWCFTSPCIIGSSFFIRTDWNAFFLIAEKEWRMWWHRSNREELPHVQAQGRLPRRAIPHPR